MSTTYMSLVLPDVGTTIGPLWATELNVALTTVDGHTHTAGSGQLITPSAININADLSFASNNATLLRSARFANQSATLAAATDLGCLYVVGGELYYRDRTGGAGFAITNNGSVNAGAGSITGLPTGNAGAAYSGGTFIFTSDTNTPADINGASLFIREAAVSTNYIKLASPGSLSASYTLTLPAALPSSPTNATGKIVSIATSGAVSAAYDVDASSLEISGSTMRVKALGVTNAMLAGSISFSKIPANADLTAGYLAVDAVTTVKILNGAVTPAKRSTAVTGYGTTGTSITSTPSGSCVIVGTGRPILFTVTSASATTPATINTNSGTPALVLTKIGSAYNAIMLLSTSVVDFDNYSFIDLVGNNGSITYALASTGDTINVNTPLLLQATEL
jgi:hypothetical protein